MNLPRIHRYLGELSDLLVLLDSLYKITPKYIYYSEIENKLRFRAELDFDRDWGPIFRHISKDDLLESAARGSIKPLRHYVEYFESDFDNFDVWESSSEKLYNVITKLHELFNAIDDLRIWIEVYSWKSNIVDKKYNFLVTQSEFEQRGEDIKTIIEALKREED